MLVRMLKLTVILLLEVVHKLDLGTHVICSSLCVNCKEVHLHQFVLGKINKTMRNSDGTYLLRRLFISKISETCCDIIAWPHWIFEERLTLFA